MIHATLTNERALRVRGQHNLSWTVAVSHGNGSDRGLLRRDAAVAQPSQLIDRALVVAAAVALQLRDGQF